MGKDLCCSCGFQIGSIALTAAGAVIVLLELLLLLALLVYVVAASHDGPLIPMMMCSEVGMTMMTSIGRERW